MLNLEDNIENNKIKFSEVISSYKKEKQNLIGLLSEKTLHAIIKKYICNEEIHHEVKLGSYYADIFYNDIVCEVQTRNLNKLREKLDYYLSKYEVYIIYPIVHTKYLSWIDTLTSEVSEFRKSPKTGKFSDCFYELYKIKMYLNNPKLHVRLMLIDCEEYRNLDGWSKDKKRGSTRFERLPLRLIDELNLYDKSSYDYFLKQLPSTFTNNDVKKILKIDIKYARLATNIFLHLGLISENGKIGKMNIYKKA